MILTIEPDDIHSGG